MYKKVKRYHKHIETTKAGDINFGDFSDYDIAQTQVFSIEVKCNLVFDTMRQKIPTKIECDNLEECILQAGKED